MNRLASSGLRQRLRPVVVFTSLIALATLMTMTFSLPPFERPAHAALVGITPVMPGPIDLVNHFPQYYGDSTGLLLQPCMTPGKCATLLPYPSLPVCFPTNPPQSCVANYPTEIFYWRAVARMPTGGGTGRATLTLATEGAFPNGVVDGQQIVFNRIRVDISGGLQADSIYTVTTPYGDLPPLKADSRGRAKFTQDTGCLLPPCDLRASIVGSVGPWLRWDSTPPAPTAGYIGDFAVLHAVTGSPNRTLDFPNGTNFFRIVGPKVGGTDVNGQAVNSIMIDQFQLQGQCAGPCP